MDTTPRKARDVFLAVIKLPADEREAYLREACAGHHDLQQRVLALLQAQAEIGSFYEMPARTVDQPITESPGTIIGPYKLIEQIGEGGMGTVWMAQQTEPVKRVVALKLIKPGMDSRQVIARFEAERQALALMDHINIARVLDAGTTDAGRPYFAMDLVKGVPITRYCDEHHLTPSQRLELFIPVCQAVQHAHQKGIIHRDLKPSNVLVALYDGKPMPKVIDFGVAKAAGQSLTNKTLVTGFGNIVGTLEYMSPEQAEINQLDIDTRSDIYSLGVLLYELLTGSPPFSRKDLEQASMLEMLRVIREQEPSKPSTKLSTAEGLPTLAANRGTEPTKLTKLVRGELDWIVMKCLEKDRSRRYETANGFAMDLARYLADEPVLACPPSLGYQLRKFTRRHKVALGMAGMAAAVLMFAVVTLVFANVRIHDALTAKTVALQEKSTALTAKTKALDDLNMAKQEIESANSNLKQAVEALSEEQNKTKLALDQERFVRYTQCLALANRELEAGLSRPAINLLNECPANLRDWEWHYLKRQCTRELAAFNGVGTPHVAFINDSPLVATINLDSQVYRWNSTDGRLVSQFRLPKMDFRGALGSRLSQNGRVAAVADEQTIRLLDCESGKDIGSIHIQEGRFNRALYELSPDGQRLAAAIFLRHDGTESVDSVRMWQVDDGRELLKLAGADFGAFLFGSEGKDLILCKGGNDIVVHDATTGTAKARWRYWDRPATYSPLGLRMTSGRSRLATWEMLDRQLRVWDLRDGKLVKEFQTGSVIREMAFHPDGLLLAAAFEDGSIKIFNPDAGKEWLSFRGHGQPVLGLAFSADGRRLLSACQSGTAKVWDSSAFGDKIPPAALVYRMGVADLSLPITCVSFSSDGKCLAAASPALGITIWQIGTRTKNYFRASAAGFNPRIALSPDGQRVATTSVDGVVRIYSSESGKEILVYRAHPGTIEDVAFSPDGALLATASVGERGAGTVRLWNAATGNEMKCSPLPSAYRVAFRPDGLQLAAVTATTGQPTARLWDVATGAELWRTKEKVPATAVAFSPDGKRLAVATSTLTARVLNSRTGEEELRLPGFESAVTDFAFHPTSDRLAAMMRDGSLVIWDVVTGREVLTLHREPNPLGKIAFRPDGRWLARAAGDGAVEILDGTP